jgi:hypothetical protein
MERLVKTSEPSSGQLAGFVLTNYLPFIWVKKQLSKIVPKIAELLLVIRAQMLSALRQVVEVLVSK